MKPWPGKTSIITSSLWQPFSCMKGEWRRLGYDTLPFLISVPLMVYFGIHMHDVRGNR